jgi:hypothetical protein
MPSALVMLSYVRPFSPLVPSLSQSMITLLGKPPRTRSSRIKLFIFLPFLSFIPWPVHVVVKNAFPKPQNTILEVINSSSYDRRFYLVIYIYKNECVFVRTRCIQKPSIHPIIVKIRKVIRYIPGKVFANFY